VDYQDKPLGQPDIFHLNAASGWLGLGDVVSANDELKQISPAMRGHPAVLLAQCEIFFTAKKWTLLLNMTGILLQQLPDLDFIWINRSYALHELKRTQEALDALLPAAKKFPKQWLIRYNLACYSAQLGQMNEALRLLKQAIRLDGKKKVKIMALEDADFEPLWKEIRSI
jgi:predicted Zn-dependent protease